MSSQNTFFSFDNTKAEVKDIDCNQKAFKDSDTCVYNILPVFSANRRPDIYLGDKLLSSKYYHNKQVNVHNATIVDNDTEGVGLEEAEMDMSKEPDSLYDNLKKEQKRYFTKDNITMKCYNCGEVGHFSKFCPNNKIIKCIKCMGTGHEERNCPQVKCFKCNKLGHRAYECKASKETIIQCNRCNNFGHISSDCLIDPKPSNLNNYSNKNKKLQKIYCAFCNKKGHFICPFKINQLQVEDYNSEDVDVSDDDDDNDNNKVKGKGINADSIEDVDDEDGKNSDVLSYDEDYHYLGMKKSKRQLFDSISNDMIKTTVFCFKCGEMHSSKNCDEKTRENVFDMRRQEYSMKKAKNQEKGHKKRDYYYSDEEDDYDDEDAYSHNNRRHNNGYYPKNKCNGYGEKYYHHNSKPQYHSSFKEQASRHNKYNNNHKDYNYKQRNNRENKQLMFNRFV